MAVFTIRTDNLALVEAITDLFTLAGEITGQPLPLAELSDDGEREAPSSAGLILGRIRTALEYHGQTLEHFDEGTLMTRDARRALWRAGTALTAVVEDLAGALDQIDAGWDTPAGDRPADRVRGAAVTD